MKIVVRGIRDEAVKDEIKAIIREFASVKVFTQKLTFQTKEI